MLKVVEPGFADQRIYPPLAAAPISFSYAKVPYESIAYIVAAMDALLIASASVASEIFYQNYFGNGVAIVSSYLGLGIIAALLYVLHLRALGFYSARAILGRQSEMSRILVSWLAATFVLTLVAFLLKIGPSFSRGSTVCFFVSGLTLVFIGRKAEKYLAAQALAKGLVQGHKSVLIGHRSELAAVDQEYLLRQFGMTEIGRFVLPNDQGSDLAMSPRDVAALNAAAEFAREASADEILLAFSWSGSRRLELVREWLRVVPLPVKLLPDQKVRSIAVNSAFNVNHDFSIDVQRAPLTRGEKLCKRAFDVAFSATLLLLLLPLLTVVAVLIRLDSPGPIIFRQRRRGFNCKQFVIYKFRTMTVQEDGSRIVQALRADSRVTPVGRWLRKSSIDELPQLVNVLRGDMSIIGPRPHALAHDHEFEKVVSEYAFRHHMKPGITGWAQCNGNRGATPQVAQIAERVRLDLWYINHWRFSLDMQILIKTFFEVLNAKNSY